MENSTITNTSMNVSLPETLKEYVQERVAEGLYSNPSDYVRALIRTDMKRRAREELEALLLEGLNSGEQEVTPDYQAKLDQEVGDIIGRATKS
jgi:antitoxin ParD1/3/4